MRYAASGMYQTPARMDGVGKRKLSRLLNFTQPQGEFVTQHAHGYSRAERQDIDFRFEQRLNPLQPSATIAFTLDSTQLVTLKIYDRFGRVVRTLHESATLPAGQHLLYIFDPGLHVEGCYARLYTSSGVCHQELTRTLNE